MTDEGVWANVKNDLGNLAAYPSTPSPTSPALG
jgi:hypothetical protein